VKGEDRLAGIELFGELSKKELRSVASLMTEIKVSAGRELMAEGTPGRECMIIVDGDATVRRKGRVVARVGPGDFLGELAVVAGVPRTASVTADTDMTIEVLNRREFSALLDTEPRVARKVLIGAVRRLHELEPGLTS